MVSEVASQISCLHDRRQVWIEPGHESIEEKILRGLCASGGTGKVVGIRFATHEDLASERTDGDARHGVGEEAAEIGRLKERRQSRVEARDERVGVATRVGGLRAAGRVGKVGRERVSRHQDFAARGVNRHGPRQILPAAAEIGRLKQRGQRRIEAGDEGILTAAPVRRLRAAGRARKVGRNRRPGDENVAARRIDRDARGRVVVVAAQVGRLEQRVDDDRSSRIVGPEPEAVRVSVDVIGGADASARALQLLVGLGRREANVTRGGRGDERPVRLDAKGVRPVDAQPNRRGARARPDREDLLDGGSSGPQRDVDAVARRCRGRPPRTTPVRSASGSDRCRRSS